jgi:nicotinic acid phosphoribosyltransferase
MPSPLLATDGYKFSMAEAGWPLRQETFYYSHRRGGPHYLPFDAAEMVKSLLPLPDAAEIETARKYLAESGYEMGGGFWDALLLGVEVKSIPKGTWFFDREPAFTVTGPSALVSWLEPLVLQLHYRIQIATIAKRDPDALGDLVGQVTCEEQRDIVLETLAAVGVEAPPITVDPEGYYESVRSRVEALVGITGDPSRIFEVGMRAASCMGQHRLALMACFTEGVQATSNVHLARLMGMKPVGTMGHEHVQRYGSDEVAFRAMRDRRSGASSFLLDTFSTMDSGIPAAFRLIAEDPTRRDSIRFDSGDKRSQYLYACMKAKGMGIKPRFILEDSFNDTLTAEFEKLREFTGIPAEDQLYGFGGYIVKADNDPLTRDRVAAVWKVTQSGPNATMKFGDEPGAGKESIPGKPVLFRQYDTTRGVWYGIVGQEGEFDTGLNLFSADHDEMRRVRFSPSEAAEFATAQGARPLYSPETQRLVTDLYAERDRVLAATRR